MQKDIKVMVSAKKSKEHCRHWFLVLPLALVFTVATMSQTSETSGRPPTKSVIEQAKQAYLEGHYLEARKLFAKAKAIAPTSADAIYGYARSLHALHLYDEAIANYQQAVKLKPDNGQIYANYVAAIAWVGILQQDYRRLTEARQKGLAAIKRWPDRIEIYSTLFQVADKLKDMDAYLQTLEVLRSKIALPDFMEVEIYRIKIRNAKLRADKPSVAQLKSEMRSKLPEITADAALPQLHKAAAYYWMLDEKDKFKDTLELLEKSVDGRRISQAYLRRESAIASIFGTSDLEKTLQVISEIVKKHTPMWESSATQTLFLGQEFDTLDKIARQKNKGIADGKEAVFSTVDIAKIIEQGKRLAEMDTWGGADWLIKTSQLLLDLNVRLEDAAQIAQAGVEKLEQRVPGMLYPGTEARREEERPQYIARLKTIQGEALSRIGKDNQAEGILRSAVSLSPGPRGYTVLGKYLLNKGKKEEAFNLLSTAAAYGFQALGAEFEASATSALKEAAAQLNKSESETAAEIAAIKIKLTGEEEHKILARKLDQIAPAFDLNDTKGNLWKLGDLKGKVIVLNFWATWCGPCHEELPYYQKLVKEYAQHADVVFLAISTDAEPQAVPPFLKEKGYDFTVLYDKSSGLDYKVGGIPDTFIIDRDGRIAYRKVGFPGERQFFKEMRMRIEALRGKS